MKKDIPMIEIPLELFLALISGNVEIEMDVVQEIKISRN